jgi:NitT/TauT family transport system substrate-binding protein
MKKEIPHMTIHRRTLVTGAAALALTPVSLRAQQRASAKFGVLPTVGAGPMFLALAKGHFAAEGLDAEIIKFDSAQTLAVAIASGDLDFGATSLAVGFYNLAAQGVMRIIAAQGRDEKGFPNNGFVVSNEAWDKGYRSFKDMPGHSVGVTTLGSAPHYCVGLIADKYKFPMSSVDLQTLKTNPNIVATVASNRIDSVITPSTFALALDRNKQGKLIGWVGDEAPWQLGAAYTSTKIADGRADYVNKFLRAYKRGMVDYADAFIAPNGTRKDGPTADAILGLLSKDLEQPPELLRAGVTYVDRDARLDGPDIARQISWYKSQGLIEGNVDANALIDKRYAKLLP